MNYVLTVAGSDSSGGAGIQADVRTIHALGSHPCAAVTALTAQRSDGVAGTHAVPPGFVLLQMESVFSDIPVAAVKTGMMATAGIVAAVADSLRKWGGKKIVVDPVMISSTGSRLLDVDGVRSLAGKLLPLAGLVTPNLQEAAVLSGMPVGNEVETAAAARAIRGAGAGAVLVTGGHVEGRPRDLLVTEDGEETFEASRIETPFDHGTGCVLSAAIATLWGSGMDLSGAVHGARKFVREALRGAYPLGGSGTLRPGGASS